MLASRMSISASTTQMPSTGNNGNKKRTLSHPGPTIFEDRLLLRPNVLEIPQQTTGLSTAGDPAQLLLDGEASVVTVWNLGKTEYQHALNNIHSRVTKSLLLSVPYMILVPAPRLSVSSLTRLVALQLTATKYVWLLGGKNAMTRETLQVLYFARFTNHNIIVAVTSSGYGPKQLGQRSMGGKVEGWQSTDWSHVDDLQACRSVLDEAADCGQTIAMSHRSGSHLVSRNSSPQWSAGVNPSQMPHIDIM
ncbi:uncharacterized protein CLUP02_11314 [Colletotrichum lupini]|uniref:Uncharacterized protein n=1 Tax=Colletotrichum lupini TaxID=145971 RepID=A0A9Q8SYL7_9PEZI|nr:uncharacterized protein CLUP02_11314 [Colletotrichum lupini]UQC85815.1 hypothetical protein CLUP02_11314 [Colletotrichum lupini]